ncbi:MAG TPA: AAA family ATPase [Solirubrobacteraceae bacterium]|nr:AAA family ATPase [Solirubrobacteraceae bacterium]
MTAGSADTLADEQRHLDRTWEAYEAVLRALEGRRTSGVDEFATEALERMRRERLRLYTESSGPLYFGRIDEEDGRVLHIGRHAIADQRNDLLAINWRAPAAQPFYTATPAERHGVRRRRRLEIEDRTVLGYVDETFAGEGDDALTGAIIEDITRRRVGEMRQIISTITPEQYELIAETVEGPLVIQGGPGTGKTAVGLHRAAWLLYTDPSLHRSGVLVVGPNAVFIAYISQVLPSLGETNVEQRAAQTLAPARGLHIAEPTDVATLKGSGRMAALLERLLWDRVGAPEEPVQVAADRVTVVVRPADVEPMLDAARARFRSHQAGRERFRALLASWIATRVMEGRRSSLAAGHEELETLVRKSKAYQGLAAKAWPRVTAEQLFGALFRNRKRLAAAADGLLEPEEVELLLRSGPPADKTLRPSDVPLLDEARWLVDPDLRTYGHVVVDEAQNLTPMELRMVVRRARGQSMTILGDIAQRTADAELASWDEVLDAAGAPRHTVRDLRISYRVPEDFLRVATTVAPDGGANAPRGVREAPWPAAAITAQPARLAAIAEDVAQRLAETVGSVAVVAPDALHDALAGRGTADADAEGHLSGRIDLLSLETIKGLEFDAIVVVEPAAILAQRPDGGAGGLYTALTRSTRALAVVHAEPLPPALAASPDLRRIEPEGVAAWLANGR